MEITPHLRSLKYPSPRLAGSLFVLSFCLPILCLFSPAKARASRAPQTASWSRAWTKKVALNRRKYTRQEIEKLIRESARRYGLPEDKVLRIAICESKLDPYVISKNRRFWGLYQFDLKTWNNTPEGRAKLDRLDPVANINAAHRHMKASGYGAWPHCKSR